jgi:DNA anti-recombination protein RmuC
MRAFQIQEQTQDIIKNVKQLGNHLAAYDEFLRKLGGHLGTTVNMYNDAYKEFKKVDKDVMRLAGGESTIEPVQVDRPRLE